MIISNVAAAKKISKAQEKAKALRDSVWPDLDEQMLWNRKAVSGFTTIPRTMPLVMNIIDALTKSTFSDHFMPYGATRFENGQNMGAQPLMTQVIKGDIRVIVPRDYREAEPVFPLRA